MVLRSPLYILNSRSITLLNKCFWIVISRLYEFCAALWSPFNSSSAYLAMCTRPCFKLAMWRFSAQMLACVKSDKINFYFREFINVMLARLVVGKCLTLVWPNLVVLNWGEHYSVMLTRNLPWKNYITQIIFLFMWCESDQSE